MRSLRRRMPARQANHHVAYLDIKDSDAANGSGPLRSTATKPAVMGQQEESRIRAGRTMPTGFRVTSELLQTKHPCIM